MAPASAPRQPRARNPKDRTASAASALLARSQDRRTALPQALSPASSAESSALNEAAGDLAALAAQPVALLMPPAAPLPAPLAVVPTPAPEPLPEPLRKPRLFIGLVGAPDVSTVRMADFQSPRPNLGIVLEYRILDRLRLSTGLLRGTKQYRAKHTDYDWSHYPDANMYKFDWVDASCTILDLPLNLRYDVLARPRYQVFGSTGLSTLFMQREAYAFDYEYYYRPYHWQREFVNENQHWFSVLNLSVGYERKLGQHWSLQAEPYVKIPLGGVGAGKVRLASGGIFLGLKYGF
jgi:hypothetical protein